MVKFPQNSVQGAQKEMYNKLLICKNCSITKHAIPAFIFMLIYSSVSRKFHSL